jgi:hypothetical protein
VTTVYQMFSESSLAPLGTHVVDTSRVWAPPMPHGGGEEGVVLAPPPLRNTGTIQSKPGAGKV